MKTGESKRQGDVTLEKVSTIPSSAKLKSPIPINNIIARGEHSNHSHCLFGDVEVLEDSDGTLFVNAKGEFELKHVLETEFLKGNDVWTKEHTPHRFPAGKYVFLPQYEYHPYEDEIRRVCD